MMSVTAIIQGAQAHWSRGNTCMYLDYVLLQSLIFYLTCLYIQGNRSVMSFCAIKKLYSLLAMVTLHETFY